MNTIRKKDLEEFKRYLRGNERSAGTIEKYLRDVSVFAAYLDGRPALKALAVQWKEHLIAEGYKPVTVNSMIAAVNAFFCFWGREECRIKPLRVQKRMFRETARELSVEEYTKLVHTAYELKQERLGLLLETMAGTGIRVSEIQYMTVESVRLGRAEISLKGKIRMIIIPEKLKKKLMKYAKTQKIRSGKIFITRSGRAMDRRQIWSEMKTLCQKAGISATKVFPHNLRHLFAQTFYRVHKNVMNLADVLGHSSVETTRLYLMSTGSEHIRQVERLGLIC